MKDSCFVCMHVCKSVHLSGVFCRQMYECVVSVFVCVRVLTDGERCWRIQITYGFLLDWLDSVIGACMDGGGELWRPM